ncbi:MAG TPA: TIGR03435 family protein [Terriglobia bacterium]|jgi:uncharacterized protein (TIGR03435 family)
MRRILIALIFEITIIPVFVTPGLSQEPKTRRPSFEVVSIRGNTSSNGGIPYTMDGGRFVATGTTLRSLIMTAYRLPNGEPFLSSQLVGLPPWADDSHFDIQAKVEDQEGAISPAEMRLRLQSMLEDRFKLNIRREMREQLVYDLTVTKNGRMKLSEDQTPLPPPPNGVAGLVPPNLSSLARGQLVGRMSASGIAWRGQAVPLERLVPMLRLQVNRPVFDKANLTGLFDIDLTFVPDSLTNGPLSTGPAALAPPIALNSGPSLFVALEEQLGLKLQPAKAPVELFEIDSVQRPSENWATRLQRCAEGSLAVGFAQKIDEMDIPLLFKEGWLRHQKEGPVPLRRRRGG